MANLEIEKRVALTADEAQAIIAKLDKQGATWELNERLLMDFSGDLENRELQIMVRVNNGQPELSIKRGGVGDTTRQEASVYLKGEVGSLLEAVNLLGYNQANYGLRSMKTCEIDGIQYSFRFIRDIKSPSSILGVNLEVEALNGKGEKDLDDALSAYGLEPLSKLESEVFFQKLHDQANTEYIHGKVEKELIAQLVKEWVSPK